MLENSTRLSTREGSFASIRCPAAHVDQGHAELSLRARLSHVNPWLHAIVVSVEDRSGGFVN